MVCIHLLNFCSKEDWIRKLPETKDKPNVVLSGKWERKTQSRAAMGSIWHKEISKEWIEFDVPQKGEFTKSYSVVNYYGSEKVEEYITGRGKYFVSGNWFLLSTEEQEIIHIDNQTNCCKGYKKFDHKLLYYYDTINNLIIPMLFESGYIEKEYGVKDGVKDPYKEEDENFKTYIKIYSFKEYHSHSYHKRS